MFTVTENVIVTVAPTARSPVQVSTGLAKLRLLPGQSDTVTFHPEQQLASGPWRATITLTSGLTRRIASATILFSPHLASSVWTSPIAMIWGGIVILSLVLLILFAVRRARQARRLPA